MATANYQRCLKTIRVFEGGKVDHPADPGGRTAYGVIQRVYNAWRKRNGKPIRDVWLIEESEIAAIYGDQYWNTVQGDLLPEGVDLVVFDGAVNSGPSQSVKWLQRALGVKADGDLGNDTMRAVETHPNHDALIVAICARRMAFLQALRTWKTFGKGWTRRVNDVRVMGLRMATGREVDEPVPPRVEPAIAKEVSQRAPIEDAAARPTEAPADAAIGGGGAAGTITETIRQTQDSLAPAAGLSDTINYILAGLGLAAAVIVIGGIAYKLWTKHRAKKRADALDTPTAVAT